MSSHAEEMDVDFAPELEERTEMDLNLIHTPRTIVYTNYDKSTVVWFSLMRIAIGMTVIGLQVVSSILHFNDEFDEMDTTGAGIWCGAVFIIAASIGIASAYERTQVLVVSHTVGSCLSLVFAGILMALSLLARFYLVHYVMLSISVLQACTDAIVIFLCARALWRSKKLENEIII